MSKARTRREDRPEIILDAAERLIRRSGTRTLTIDAVAAEASLSKGGVLHHYASKDALISALADRKVARLEAEIRAAEDMQPSGPASVPLAMIAHARQTYAEEDGFPRALLLATAESPDICSGFGTFLKSRLGTMEAVAQCPGEGRMLLFAILGLMLSRTLGFHSLEDDELESTFDALERAARRLPGA